MSSTVAERRQQPAHLPSPPRSFLFFRRMGQFFLMHWELYPILFLAALFRLYGVKNAPYNDDQAGMWRFVHDSIVHHVLPASSNFSSQGILHGYFISYFLLPVAALTSNPMWGAVETGLFNVFGVLLTYIFIRRYYGRLTGSLAAALYAVSTIIVLYNSYIWQPNLVPPLVVGLLFCLYWGAVERRKGWFFPAVVLLGLLYETHESSIYMLLPFAAAFILAGWKTIRLRDLVFCALALAIIFFPYIVWLQASHFSDILVLLKKSKAPPTIDSSIFKYYFFFTSPYINDPVYLTGGYMRDPSTLVSTLPTNPQSILANSSLFMLWVRRFLRGVHFLMPRLAIGGGLLILLRLFFPLPAKATSTNIFARIMQGIVGIVTGIYNDPVRRGYVLLILWQGVLPVLLMRYTIPLFVHYTIYLLPGPYILIALFLGKGVQWTRLLRPHWQLITRPLAYFVIGVALCGEIIGTAGTVRDIAHGVFDGGQNYPIYTNDVASVRNAVESADKLAQARHLSRVYIATNLGVSQGVRYFAENMHTPVTILDAGCLLLPNVKAGPVAYLVAPYDPLANALIHQYATATLVAQPSRIGGAPFNLYVLSPKPVAAQPRQVFSSDLQLLDSQAKSLHNMPGVRVMSWQLTRATAPAWRTTYHYYFDVRNPTQDIAPREFSCSMTSIQPQEQLLIPFPVNALQAGAGRIEFVSDFKIWKPVVVHSGPFWFQTYIDRIDLENPLFTPQKHAQVGIPFGD